MAKNIVICCDGTGNELKENLSNVLKLFRTLKKDDKQIAFYDPGIGTLGNSDAWSRLKYKSKAVFGLATGYGLDKNVLDAYEFLVQHYDSGDQIYLFGFSRGAHTVRVLAGFIHMVGLLSLEQLNLSRYALTSYKQASEKNDFKIAWRCREILETHSVTIRFMGCWDTVGSIITPRPDRFYIPSLESLPYTRKNPSVKVFRHAMAIDERRRMFRVSLWKDPQNFKLNPFVKNEDAEDQDIKQVWFAGVHSDVGGGYPESESGIAKIPLQWMLEEAEPHGLVLKKRMMDRLVLGNNPKNSSRNYVCPDPLANLHDSMGFWWQILEWIPKAVSRREWPDRNAMAGVYFPRSEPRFIEEDATIHQSVRQRVESNECNTPYRPENLPNSTPQE